jgi:GTP-binding protein LepA
VNQRIRNFCIIAHIDHGKSTLADRLLDATGTLNEREKRAQFLDKMDLERERGITIKAQTARMRYTAADGEEYILNLIDTPGHVDFSYEVSRALQACEGAILVVDAAQGIEAQTLANAYLAVDAGLEIIPVVNKIDLPAADPDRVAQEIEDVIGLDAADVLPVSAKEGKGIGALLERIVSVVPPPSGDESAPAARARVRRVVRRVRRRRDARARDRRADHPGQRIKMMAVGLEREIQTVNVLDPHPRRVEQLAAGEVGMVVAGSRRSPRCGSATR